MLEKDTGGKLEFVMLEEDYMHCCLVAGEEGPIASQMAWLALSRRAVDCPSGHVPVAGLVHLRLTLEVSTQTVQEAGLLRALW